jgi:asparagine synthase (glutamine-hydrolysing)
MCGINGIAYTPASGRSVDKNTLVQMRDVLIHRGPDESGVFAKKNVGLGHRRLSIVDLATGQQPMFSRDGTRIIVYNGEIYNHKDLRKQLTAKGYEYISNSDTETILHLYEEYGAACVHKLRGMFAFAIWDETKQELFIARDRLGVKPLYYFHDSDGNLFFGSEIKAILKASPMKAELNYNALPDYLANHGASNDETLFTGVRRLLPGQVLVWKDGLIDVDEYWDISFEPKQVDGSDEDIVNQWLELFRKSVELRLMSDVPLGMFLSGGIDSSAICAIMSQIVGDPIKTFSVGFRDNQANEFEYARVVSKAFKTEHHEIVITPEDFFGSLPNLVWHEDEPIGFSASIPLYHVSKLAETEVKVVLTGEGSDEILAGYSRYVKAKQLMRYGQKYESITPQFLRSALKAGVSTLPKSVNRKLNRTFITRNADVESLFFDNFSVFGRAMQGRLLSVGSKERIDDLNPYTFKNHLLAKTDARGMIDRFLYVDSKTYLHELLMKQDQMSMAASIESRVPFLDHELVEFTARMPERFKLRGRITKWALREAMKGILPEIILSRPKMGFPVPFGSWIRESFGQLLDDLLLSERATSRGIFDPSFIKELVARHRGGENQDERLWHVLNFEIWNRIFIDGEEPGSIAAEMMTTK